MGRRGQVAPFIVGQAYLSAARQLWGGAYLAVARELWGRAYLAVARELWRWSLDRMLILSVRAHPQPGPWH